MDFCNYPFVELNDDGHSYQDMEDWYLTIEFELKNKWKSSEKINTEIKEMREIIQHKFGFTPEELRVWKTRLKGLEKLRLRTFFEEYETYERDVFDEFF